MAATISPAVHHRWPSEHEAALEGRAAVLDHYTRREFQCTRCGLLVEVSTNFRGRDYLDCRRCGGWTLHQSNLNDGGPAK